jgi:hypothetical protein
VRDFWGVKCPNFACECMMDEMSIGKFASETIKHTYAFLIRNPTSMQNIELNSFTYSRFGSTISELFERERKRSEAIRNHVLFGDWAKQIRAKCCPKCFVPIEKNQGCDHMYCIECKSPFSWAAAPRFGSDKHWYRPNKFGDLLTK